MGAVTGQKTTKVVTFFANVAHLPPWADIRQIVQGSEPNVAQVSAWDKFDHVLALIIEEIATGVR